MDLPCYIVTMKQSDLVLVPCLCLVELSLSWPAARNKASAEVNEWPLYLTQILIPLGQICGIILDLARVLKPPFLASQEKLFTFSPKRDLAQSEFHKSVIL